MAAPSVVLDTNVIVSALRSRKGASFRVLSLVGRGIFDIQISVSLMLEYEAVAMRTADAIGLPPITVDLLLNYLCAIGKRCDIHYRWRPVLIDPKDEFVLELAINSQCSRIVSYNKKDLAGAQRFGVRVLTPMRIPARDWRDLMATIQVNLPDGLHATARELAARENISLDLLLSSALAEKVSVLLGKDYLQLRAEKGSREGFEEVLRLIPDVEPEEYDRL